MEQETKDTEKQKDRQKDKQKQDKDSPACKKSSDEDWKKCCG